MVNIQAVPMNCLYDMTLKVMHWNPYETDIVVTGGVLASIKDFHPGDQRSCPM